MLLPVDPAPTDCVSDVIVPEPSVERTSTSGDVAIGWKVPPSVPLVCVEKTTGPGLDGGTDTPGPGRSPYVMLQDARPVMFIPWIQIVWGPSVPVSTKPQSEV